MKSATSNAGCGRQLAVNPSNYLAQGPAGTVAIEIMAESLPKKATVVIIDDEQNMGVILSRVLQMEGYHVTAFTDPAAGLAHIHTAPPDLVLTDMRMPEVTGMDVLRATRETSPETNVIVMTAYATVEKAVECMREGAFDYITKPFKTDELLLTVAKAVAHTHLVRENEMLSETLNRQSGVNGDGIIMVGQSDAMGQINDLLQRVAPTDSAVLIRGESGTGKELIAKSLHQLSPRHKQRFVAINCASIPENLLESELFGHEKGSFTGADRTKMGLVELAHKGTLFLDEIGELPMALQSKLLRVLQEREIQRVGGVHSIQVDIRLIAATNRSLRRAIAHKEFREDLYYRLNVIEIKLPPLRDRTGDVPVLVDHFLEKICRRMNRRCLAIAPEAVEALEKYAFPGNVRELENVIERCIVLTEGDVIELEDIPQDIRRAVEYGMDVETARLQSGGYPAVTDAQLQQGAAAAGNAGQRGAGAASDLPTDFRDARDMFERDYLTRALAAAKGNVSEASRTTGLSRRHFYEKMDKLGMRDKDGEAGGG